MALCNDYSSLASEETQEMMVGYHAKLKAVGELLSMQENQLECFRMIDALENLAIDYHFLEEIEDILHRLYKSLTNAGGVIRFASDHNLFEVSLCFRLFLQHGYHVPVDVFKTFLDEDGEFDQTLSKDLEGMMALYEASHLEIGEEILEQAKAFCTRHLSDSLTFVDPYVANSIEHCLANPRHKSLARFTVKNYIKNFEMGDGTYIMLQELAKMDFNIVQSLHQTELVQVLTWWEDLGLTQKLKFARDQPLKWYMWTMAALADPRLSKQRIELTKPVALVYILDDIFDVYGTIDKLILLTEAINKWEINAIEKLPQCMKIFLKALFDVTDDISYKVFKQHGWNPLESLKNAWMSLCNAFLVEAKWFASGHVPEEEEYLKNAVISSGVPVVLIHIFFLLGHGINKDTIDLVDSIPAIISSPATILRLWDDLGSAKDEHQEGYDGSYMECYMKEHRSSTVESTQKYVMSMISNEWKTLNRESLSPDIVPASMRKASLNAARMVELMYNYDEKQGLPKLEGIIRSVLYEKIPLHS